MRGGTEGFRGRLLGKGPGMDGKGGIGGGGTRGGDEITCC